MSWLNLFLKSWKLLITGGLFHSLYFVEYPRRQKSAHELKPQHREAKRRANPFQDLRVIRSLKALNVLQTGPAADSQMGRDVPGSKVHTRMCLSPHLPRRERGLIQESRSASINPI